MGVISKEGYERKADYAARRAADDAEQMKLWFMCAALDGEKKAWGAYSDEIKQRAQDIIDYNCDGLVEDENGDEVEGIDEDAYNEATENAGAAADALATITSMRHSLHTSKKSVFLGTDNGVSEYFNRELEGGIMDDIAGLGEYPRTEKRALGINGENIINIEWLDGEEPRNGETRDDVRDRLMVASSEQLERLNSAIEAELRDIDAYYGTSACPSGASRIM